MSAINKYLVTAAIDFGTTYSGYAYSHHADKNVVHVNSNWKSGSQSFKVPTAILFDDQRNFISFGFAAEDDYSGYGDSKEEHSYLLFHRFKMSLYNATDVSRNISIKAVNGKTMKAIDVFSEAIKYLKQHLIHSINELQYGGQVTADNVQWVLTVPAIWSDAARHFMKEAAEKAGIKSENLLIALEPECASIHCKTLPIGKLPRSIDMNKIGDKYMVVDIGGGTVDITVHEILEKGKIKELHKATGNNSGGTNVDKCFEDYLIKLFTAPVIEHIKSKKPSEWLEIERDFEATKRSVDTKSVDDTVLFLLKPCLHETYPAYNTVSLVDAFKEGNSVYAGASLQGNHRMRLPVRDFQDMVVSVTAEIKAHVTKLLKQIGKPLDYVILVGGFSNSSIVLEEIRKIAGKIPVIRPLEAELAVVRGAVLYGISPNTIISRKARKTYGIAVSRDFKPGDPDDLSIVNELGVKKCKQCFETLVKVNESVVIGDVIHRSYYPFDSTDTSMTIRLFASLKKDVSHCTESGVFTVGELTVKMPNTSGGRDRAVRVGFHFGKTTLEVDAKDITSGESVMQTYDFLTD